MLRGFYDLEGNWIPVEYQEDPDQFQDEVQQGLALPQPSGPPQRVPASSSAALTTIMQSPLCSCLTVMASSSVCYFIHMNRAPLA